jgi:hypothetical protein
LKRKADLKTCGPAVTYITRLCDDASDRVRQILKDAALPRSKDSDGVGTDPETGYLVYRVTIERSTNENPVYVECPDVVELVYEYHSVAALFARRFVIHEARKGMIHARV